MFGEKRIFIFEDFSMEVQKKRREYHNIKNKFQALGIQYAMFFPAVLRVSSQGRVNFFKTCDAAK